MKFKAKFIKALERSIIGISFSVLTIWPSLGWSKNPESIPFREYQDEMRQEGQFLSVHLSMGNPIRIFVVGKEEAKVDLSKMKISVKRIDPYPGKILKTDRYDNYFVVNDPTEIQKEGELEINLETPKKLEKFKFKLKSKVP